MGTEHYCRWVRPRLPLMAGGELGVEERRRVERHLIGCLGCRDHRDASTSALTALRAFGRVSPIGVDTPSLWPSLAAQIRQSRHVVSRTSWWENSWPRPWTALSVATGLLGVVLVASLMPPAARQTPRSSMVAVGAALPKVPDLAFSPRRSALPTGTAGALPRNVVSPSEPASMGSPFNYDLDHGTPMGPGNRDPQHSY